MKLKVMNSSLDKSVNFIEQQLAGFLEARYVKRPNANYFIAYLSSHNGCNRGCKFCHLTTSGQLDFVDTNHNDFISQAVQIFRHFRTQNECVKYMAYNFMARGEPLANQTILENGDDLLSKLGIIAKEEGLSAKFNVSTIMPLTLKKSLVDVFSYITPTIYYSLYSTDPAWRKKWMPGAMPYDTALHMLKEYQDFSKKIVKIHYPFVANENDSVEQINSVCDALDRVNLTCEFNLVRYNTASPEQGSESSEEVIQRNIELMKERFRFLGKVQVIPRVGLDVKASCGMFV